MPVVIAAGLFAWLVQMVPVIALRQTDLILALTFLIGKANGYTIAAATSFLIVHSLYKAALFLAVGIIDHQTGTREANKLFGMACTMPRASPRAKTDCLPLRKTRCCAQHDRNHPNPVRA